MKKVKKRFLINFMMCFLFACSTSFVPAEFFEGYEKAIFEEYDSPAKENGHIYEKIYINGKMSEVFIYNNSLVCEVKEDNKKKWLVFLENYVNEKDGKYNKMKEKRVCVAGIYIGHSKERKQPVLYVNKIYDLNNKNTIISETYGNYQGILNEKGKVITKDFDFEDNINVDFYDVRFQLPNNYKLSETTNKNMSFDILYDSYLKIEKQEFGNIKNKINNMNQQRISEIWKIIISDKGEILNINSEKIYLLLLNDYVIKGKAQIKTKLKDDKNIILNIEGLLFFKNNNFYALCLFNNEEDRFDRTEDFECIYNTIIELNPPRMPQSYGSKKSEGYKISN